MAWPDWPWFSYFTTDLRQWLCIFVRRSFQPDFVLVRQHARNANDNWKHTILGLHYGGVSSVNSLESVYNFLDRPWVVSIDRRLWLRRRDKKIYWARFTKSIYAHRQTVVQPVKSESEAGSRWSQERKVSVHWRL